MKRIPLRGKTPPSAPVPLPVFAERSPEKYRASQVVPPGAVFLLEEPMHGWPPGWTIKLYDVGLEEQVRAVYPDCWQIHPLAWHRDRLTAAGINFSHLERKVVVPVVPVVVKQRPTKKMTEEEHYARAAADHAAIVGTPPDGWVSKPERATPPVQRVKLRPR